MMATIWFLKSAFVSVASAVAPAPVLSSPLSAPSTVIPNPASTGTTAATASVVSFPNLLLSFLVWGTLVIALIILLMPERTEAQKGRIRNIALFGAGAALFFSFLALSSQFTEGGGTSQTWEEIHDWFTLYPLHFDYHLSSDGTSLPLIFVSCLIFTILLVTSWRVQQQLKLYCILLLLVETGVNGGFLAFNSLLFIMFWGLQIIPTYLLIGLWGSGQGIKVAKRYLTFSIVAVSCLSTSLLLAGYAAIQNSAGGALPAFDFNALATANFPGAIGNICFWLALVAFAIALGIVPFHQWRISAQSEASSPIAALLGGPLLLFAAYGTERIVVGSFGMQGSHFSALTVAFAGITVAWGALGALKQTDLRQVAGYLSLTQAGVVLLALGSQNSVALVGMTILLCAYAMGIVAIHLLIEIIELRTRTTSLDGLGGLLGPAPGLGSLWTLAVFSAIGIPFLAGFAGDFMVFTGSFSVHRIATVFIMIGTVVVSGYWLWLTAKIFYGPTREAFSKARDVGGFELSKLLPLTVVMVIFGIFPGRFIPIVSEGVLNAITNHLVGR